MFVIDTDEYSGNFVREMCGYLTGRWDEETHGEDEAKIADAELQKKAMDYLKKHVVFGLNDTDDIPHYSPCVIVPTPGYWNNGAGTNTKGKPPEGKQTYPAYQSVGIFFDEIPPPWIIDILKERAKKFCSEYWANAVWKNSNIKKGSRMGCIGFRIIKEYVEKESQVV